MIALFLLLVIAAMVVGVVIKGLLYLLFIGIVVFLAALILGTLRMRRRPADIQPGKSVGHLQPGCLHHHRSDYALPGPGHALAPAPPLPRSGAVGRAAAAVAYCPGVRSRYRASSRQ